MFYSSFIIIFIFIIFRTSNIKAIVQVVESTDAYHAIDESFANASDLVESLRRVHPVFNKSCLFLKRIDYVGLCLLSFQEILTESGICHTFNTLDQRNIYRQET